MGLHVIRTDKRIGYMKKPITLSLPENVLRDLHFFIAPRRFSEFISECIMNGLEHRRNMLLHDLRAAYTTSQTPPELGNWNDDD